MKTSSRLALSVFVNLLYLPAIAGEILSVNAQKVIILLTDEEPLRRHQRFSITHPDTGNKTGVIEIVRKKGNKALGKLLRGYARKGGHTAPADNRDDLAEEMGAKSSKSFSDVTDADPEGEALLEEVLASNQRKKPAPRAPTSIDEGGPSNPFYEPEEEPSIQKSNPGHWGFGLGVTPTTISVSNEFGQNTLKGNNFVVRIAFDKPIKKSFGILFGANYLPIAGTHADDAFGMAKVEANYLSFEMNGRINFVSTPMQGPWIGGGINYMMSNSATSNVIDPQSLGNHTLFQFCLGYNARMNNEYLTFRGDFLLHPQTTSGGTNVKINQYILSAIYFF